MQRRYLLATFMLTLVTAGFATPDVALGDHKLSRTECKAIGKKMNKLQSQLRQSHSAKQGRRYRQRMRELQLKRFRHC